MVQKDPKIIIPVVGFMLALLISIFVFDMIPHVQDSIAQLFQARIFLKGKLYYRSHPLSQFFDYTHMINNGRWYSQYPPGHPLLLAIGLLFNAPFVINPILAAIGIFLTMMIARDFFTKRTSLISSLLLILSPFYIFMAGSHMSHVGSMLFLTLFLFAVMKEKFILAGIGLGIAFLIRPYTAFLYAVPVLFFIRSKKIIPLTISFIPFIVLLLLYNYLTNGDPFTFGYTVLYGKNVGLGFGKSAWGIPHTPSRGLTDGWDNIRSLSSNLFEWPIPSVMPFLIPIFFFKKRYLIFYLIPASLLVGHIFYWYHDLCLGPRFLYESLPPIIILSAVGIDLLIEKVRRSNLVYAGLAALFIFSVTVRIPYLVTKASPGEALPYGRSFWGVDSYLDKLVKELKIKHSIIFVDMHYPMQKIDPDLWFGSAFLHDTPDLNGRVIYAHHLGMDDTLLMNYYPDRNYYLYQGYLRQGKLMRLER